MKPGALHTLGLCCAVALLPWVAPAAAAGLPTAVESAFQSYVSLPDALLPVLESARDKASADRAAADLQALLPRVYEARCALRKIESLTPEEQRLVRERYETAMRTRWGKVFDHIFRLQRKRCYESINFFKHFNTFCVMLEK